MQQDDIQAARGQIRPVPLGSGGHAAQYGAGFFQQKVQ